MYQPQLKTWTKGEIKEKRKETRSYIVNTQDGSELRRNRQHLKPLTETKTQTSVTKEENKPPPTDIKSSPVSVQVQPGPQEHVGATEFKTTRSGRIVRLPNKLKLCIQRR